MISGIVANLHRNGHCYGMSKTAQYYFLHPEKLPEGIVTAHDFGLPKYNLDLQRVIDEHQNSFADPYVITKLMSLWFGISIDNVEYNSIKSSVSNGVPALTLLRSTKKIVPWISITWPHAVLTYKVDDSLKTLYVYDPRGHK